MKSKIFFSFCVFLCMVSAALLFADETWQGNAAVSLRGELDRDGYYAASNSFPPGTKVLVTNLDNNKRVIVTVRQRLNGTSNVFILLSANAANELGMKSNDVIRIKTQVVGISTDLTGGIDLAQNRDMETNPSIGAPDLTSPTPDAGTRLLADLTPSPSPTPTPWPSPSPTVTPTPSPSPSPSPSLTPTPIPTVTPNATDTKQARVPEKDRFALPYAPETGELSARTNPPARDTEAAGDIDLKEARVALKEKGDAVILSRPPNESDGQEEEVVAILIEPKNTKKAGTSSLSELERPTPDRETVEAALNNPELAEKDKPFIYERHGVRPDGEALALASQDLPEVTRGERPEITSYARSAQETERLALETHSLPEVTQGDRADVTALSKTNAEKDQLALESHSLPEVTQGERADVTALAKMDAEKDKTTLESHSLPEVKQGEKGDVTALAKVDADKDRATLESHALPDIKEGEKPDLTTLAKADPVKDKPTLSSANLPNVKDRETPDVLQRTTAQGKDKKSVDLALVPTNPNPPKKTIETRTVVTNIPDKTVPDNTHTTRVEPDKTNTTVWDQSLEFTKNYYYLQLGVFTSREAADKIIRAYPSYPMLVINGRNNSADVFKVVVGPLKRDETGTAIYLFKAKGYRDAFLRYIE
jgi:hypothetical protein